MRYRLGVKCGGLLLGAALVLSGCSVAYEAATGVKTENYTANNVHIDQVVKHHGSNYKTRNYPSRTKYVWHSHNITRSRDVYLGSSRNGPVITHTWGKEHYNVPYCISYSADKKTGMVGEVQRGICDSVLYPEAEAAARAVYGYGVHRLWKKVKE